MTNEITPTDVLREEHQSVLQKLDLLEEIIGHLAEKEKISGQLKELASFFKQDFWTHFAKEENALFPELEKFIPREAGPIAVMLMEHDDLRRTNEELQPAINEYLGSADSLSAKELIERHGSHFISILRDHIAKENDILFMMAEIHLDQAQIDKVTKLFHEIE